MSCGTGAMTSTDVMDSCQGIPDAKAVGGGLSLCLQRIEQLELQQSAISTLYVHGCGIAVPVHHHFGMGSWQWKQF